MDDIDTLIDKLRSGPGPDRVDAARALGSTGDMRAVPPLVDALKDWGDWVSCTAAEALGKLRTHAAVSPLIAALNDHDGSVRQSVAIALGEIGDARAVDPLIDALKDSDWSVRFRAAEALGKIGDDRATYPLMGVLEDADFGVRRAAGGALVKIGDLRAVPPLTNVLGNPDVDMRLATAEILGKLADGRAIPPLYKALDDQNNEVREASARALQSIQQRLATVTKDVVPSIICPKCLCRFTEHKAKVSRLRGLSYFACRECHGSQFVDRVIRVVAALDHSFDRPYLQEGTTLLVNWYSRKAPIDFDEVRIVDASDFDIDELVMKLRNDMDDKRRKRYKSMPVYLSPQLQLSHAKINMLKDTFGMIEEMKR